MIKCAIMKPGLDVLRRQSVKSSVVETRLFMIGLIFWLVLIPFCIGLVPAFLLEPHRRSPGIVFLGGYFLMWAIFEITCIPWVLISGYHNFTRACDCFMVLAVLCAVAGILLWYYNGKKGGNSLLRAEISGKRQKRTLFGWGVWLIFLVLLGFQIYKALAYASFDGDDAYYVVESLIAQQSDTMYTRLPYTGRATSLDIRHALAVFPMWVAFIAVQGNIHATIVSHMVMPVVLMGLAYLLYFEIARCLFKDREQRSMFMVVIALFQIFGNVSIYTNETFFLTRTWQGKAVAGSLVIPAIVWMFLRLFGREKENGKADRGLWLLLVCINMTAGICSSIAVFLISLFIAVSAFVLMIARRDFKVVLRLGAVCIPNVLYMGLYFLIGHTSLWQYFL